MNANFFHKKQFSCLSGCSLKLIAVITMLIDHIGAVLFPEMMVLRYIGRIAFPIYVFLLVQGFFHTSDLRKYKLRMLLFALLSEVPFDLAFNGSVLEFSSQNVFFTLFLGLVMLDLMRYTKDRRIMELMTLIFFAVIAIMLSSDYSACGIIFIYIFWKYKDHPGLMFICIGVLAYLFYGTIECWCLIAFLPIWMYNGKRGGLSSASGGGERAAFRKKAFQYAFYLFYPVHLLLLYGIGLV